MSAVDRETYMKNHEFINISEISAKYEKITKVGQGTFGKVYKAKVKKDPDTFVALKKIMTENESEGYPITALREMKILQKLDNEHVVKLIEICNKKGSRKNNFAYKNYLVMEFCEHDLAGLLSNKMILHRDLKSSNILMTKKGILKLADFGLAKPFSFPKPNHPNRYTNKVVTLWYRPPELLLGETNYVTSIDLWGAGCIMAEMWTRTPILQGHTEQQQLTLISQFCGSITSDVWPSVEKLELFNKITLPQGQKRKVIDRLKPYCHTLDPYACDLIDKLLTLDPSKRFDADSALNHDFFWTDPMPCDLGKMLAQHTRSMFEYLMVKRPHHQQVPDRHAKRNKLSNDSGYHERIF
ncbi:hypothetical protein HCN44_003525 [Aphidius gifuensis]|uniref:Protein kinase domain-containing protein n=1 Tax=Aphidius gifuensis TaxID=684658 RepID=A0A835CKX0_APHGI|nr:hypothetical protein HCN44_003525 [Aphidius gifuensis]